MSKTMTEQSVKQKAYTNVNRRSRKRELGDVSNKFTWLSQPSGSSCKRPTAIADIVYLGAFEKYKPRGLFSEFYSMLQILSENVIVTNFKIIVIGQVRIGFQ